MPNPMQLALLLAIENAIKAVLSLTEAITHDQLLDSPYTQREVRKRLRMIAEALDELACGEHVAFAELDRDGWLALVHVLEEGGALEDEALTFAVGALAPRTLSWLHVYRSQRSTLFAIEA